MGIIVVVSVAFAGGNSLHGLYELIFVIDPYQSRVSSDLHFFADVLCRQGVATFFEHDMMVTMNNAGRKGRYIKALSFERQKHFLLLLLEDEEWPLPGSTVDAQTGSGAAPLICFSLSMFTIDEFLSLEKIFSYVPYLVFNRPLGVVIQLHPVKNLRNSFSG